ncbi:MAG: protein kinase [Deltaproteobacteria bacterium]|nr:protein kinase [Deltaproteobacteria bacterium]
MQLPKTVVGSSGRYVLLRQVGAELPFDLFEASDRVDVPPRFRVERIGDAAGLSERVQRDAQEELARAHNVSDPTFLQVLDYGTIDGRPFGVRPLVEGWTLLELFGSRTGPPPVEIAIHAVVVAAKALSGAHARAAPHGTLTPASIVVSRSGRVRVDGLGRAAATWASRAPREPAFLAPEVSIERPALPTADAFALASVLATFSADGEGNRDLTPVLRAATSADPARRTSCDELARFLGAALIDRLATGARRRALREYLQAFRIANPGTLGELELGTLDTVYKEQDAADDEFSTIDSAAFFDRSTHPPEPADTTPEVLDTDSDDVPPMPAMRLRIEESTPTPARSPRATTIADDDEPGTDPRIGQLIRGYRVSSVIGAGSFATVYAATHEILGSRCAVKVLTASDTPDAAERLVREAKFLSRVSHPNLVTIFDCGKTDDGLPFLSMELLEGQTLSRTIKLEAPMTPGRTLEIGRQIAEAIGAAHAEGLVHRDLKPANVMLVPPNERVKVLDFGIARAFASDQEVALTRVGQIVGTPTYMAPEQIVGNAKLGPSADFYSLGVVMYAMLTGEPPFLGGVAEILEQHVRSAPEPAPDADGLGPIVMSLLAKDPGQRPANADEVIRQLDELRAGWTRPKTLAPVSLPPARGPNLALYVAVASAVVLVLALAILLLW